MVPSGGACGPGPGVSGDGDAPPGTLPRVGCRHRRRGRGAVAARSGSGRYRVAVGFWLQHPGRALGVERWSTGAWRGGVPERDGADLRVTGALAGRGWRTGPIVRAGSTRARGLQRPGQGMRSRLSPARSASAARRPTGNPRTSRASGTRPCSSAGARASPRAALTHPGREGSTRGGWSDRRAVTPRYSAARRAVLGMHGAGGQPRAGVWRPRHAAGCNAALQRPGALTGCNAALQRTAR